MTPDRMLPDALIERIADGEATIADWAAFRAAANIETSLWQDLAVAQRTHAELSAQVQAALAPADRVEAPAEEHMTEGLARRIRMVGSWGGWAAAAAVFLAWSAGLTPGSGASRNAGILNVPSTPQQALQTYLDEGKQAGLVLDELPTKVMIETRPSTTGPGYEVIYLRQIMERTIVRELYRPGVDDAGQIQPVPVEFVPVTDRPM